MKTIALRAAAGALLVTAPACLSASTRAGYEDVLHESAALEAPSARQRPELAAADERELATRPSLAVVERVAMRRNPELRTARERLRASAARVPAAGRLPDPELKYEQWAVPLDRPYSLDKAGMLMLGVRQSFPAPGSLDAQSRAALQEAQMTLQAQRARMRDLRAEVERAYFEYARTESERQIHLEHQELTHRMLELARNLYTAGRATQVDVIRLQVELSRLHTDLVELVAQQRSARALLNRLMARPADAPLGPPPPLTVSRVEPRLAAIEARMLKERPELVAARHAVARSQATLDSARKTADLPSFAVGIDYWLMPQASDPHAYGAMVSMSLPWLNPQHGEQVREAEHALDAERSALDAERDAARYALRDSVAQLHAARESFAIVQDELLPRAREAYEAAEAALVSGQGDGRSVLETLRTYLEVRIEQSRALARERTALSEVERSAGVELMDGEREASHE